jgi:hypothetical protein
MGKKVTLSAFLFNLGFYLVVGVFGLISLCEETPEIFLLRKKVGGKGDL